MNYLSEAWTVLKEAAADWMDDNAARLGAALAFYSVLSLAPLLVIAIAIAALVFDEQAASKQILAQIRGLVGNEGALAIEAMIQNAKRPDAGIIATVLGVATLLFGASGVFGELQSALNTIWEVRPKPGRGVWGYIRDRFLSLTMVLGTGFLLLVSLILSACISGASQYLGNRWPGLATALPVANGVISFLVVMVLFAMIFKFLPDVNVRWRDVWVGAALTSLLFTLGKLAIGLYLGNMSIGSAYGAAGSFVVLVVWIYYSAQILFFGAELTQVYAKRYGARIVPNPNAFPVTHEARAQQGMA